MGIKNLRDFNYSLQGMWVRKIIKERCGLWIKSLIDQYGSTEGIFGTSDTYSSLWWRGIYLLDIRDREKSEVYSVKWKIELRLLKIGLIFGSSWFRQKYYA